MIAVTEDFKKSRTWPTGIDVRKYYDQVRHVVLYFYRSEQTMR